LTSLTANRLFSPSSILFFFTNGKAQIQIFVNLFARRRGHGFTAQTGHNDKKDSCDLLA